jgi:hypothetical protein
VDFRFGLTNVDDPIAAMDGERRKRKSRRTTHDRHEGSRPGHLDRRLDRFDGSGWLDALARGHVKPWDLAFEFK